MEDNEYRRYTKHELLINLRNETLDRIIRSTINVQYFRIKAIGIPKKDPNKQMNINKSIQFSKNVEDDTRLLTIIDAHISEEEKRMKNTKTKKTN